MPIQIEINEYSKQQYIIKRIKETIAKYFQLGVHLIYYTGNTQYSVENYLKNIYNLINIEEPKDNLDDGDIVRIDYKTKQIDEKKGFFKRHILSEKQVGIVNFIGNVKFDGKMFVTSYGETYDKEMSKIAVDLAKEFNVVFRPRKYEPDKEQGTITCQYCGRDTKDVVSCINCGGKPV